MQLNFSKCGQLNVAQSREFVEVHNLKRKKPEGRKRQNNGKE
jgi:hypothetical protein